MSRLSARLRPGDVVEVLPPDEILKTLDANGAVDALPFMPEMAEYCGRRFRVSNRVVKVCFTGPNSSPRKFMTDDVVLLEDLRCSGQAHDGCQKACTIFWRDRWLRKVRDTDGPANTDPAAKERLRAGLRTAVTPNVYYCQASEILKATEHLSRQQRYALCLTDVREGNCSAAGMLFRVARFLLWTVRLRYFGDYRSGTRKVTAGEVLNLQSGDLVQVKPVDDVVDTLDSRGHHRGLLFMQGMRGSCGKTYTVLHRIERIILDGTGEMRKMRNTVRLEGSVCGCPHQYLGGCSRGEINYWREIWLRRSNAPR